MKKESNPDPTLCKCLYGLTEKARMRQAIADIEFKRLNRSLSETEIKLLKIISRCTAIRFDILIDIVLREIKAGRY